MRKSHLTFEYIGEFAKQYEFELLDFYEKENKKYVSVKCRNGHIHDLTWHCFKYKHGCKECNRKYTKEFIITYVSEYNYIVSSFEGFTDLNSKIIFKCSKGHPLRTSFANFMNGRRCFCEGGKYYYTLEEMRGIFKQEGCVLLTDFKEQKDLVEYICNCGNPSTIRIDHFLNGVRCDECAKIKRRETLYQNGTAPCSRQQRYLYNLLGGELNYPLGKCSLDIAFPLLKICIEYNGSGHDIQVRRFKNISIEEFNKKELKRDRFIKSKGYFLMYINSKKDYLPSDEILFEMFNYAKYYLSADYWWIKFDIDNSKIITSQYEKDYDFGILRKIVKKDIFKEAI